MGLKVKGLIEKNVRKCIEHRVVREGWVQCHELSSSVYLEG